jgi:CRP-like cAMP-binding protein
MQLNEKVEVLKKSPIFSTLNETDLKKLARITIERRLKPDEFLIWEKDVSKYIYIVGEGKIKVFIQSSRGKEFILDFFHPGHLFGPISIFCNRSSSASAQSVAHTKVLGIKKEEFISFISRNPQVSLSIIRILALQIRALTRRLKDTAWEKVEQRLARTLLILSAKLGPNIFLTRQELAELTGTTTETVIRIISSWKKKKVVTSVRGKTVLLDEAVLRSLSKGL